MNFDQLLQFIGQENAVLLAFFGFILVGGFLWFFYAVIAKFLSTINRIWTARQLRKAIENSDSRQIEKFLKKLEKGDVKINL